MEFAEPITREPSIEEYALGVMPQRFMNRHQLQKEREIEEYQKRWEATRKLKRDAAEKIVMKKAAIRTLNYTLPGLTFSLCGVYWIAITIILRIDALIMAL